MLLQRIPLGPDRFRLALHVAMQIGPYLHRLDALAVFGIWPLRILNAPDDAPVGTGPHRSW